MYDHHRFRRDRNASLPLTSTPDLERPPPAERELNAARSRTTEFPEALERLIHPPSDLPPFLDRLIDLIFANPLLGIALAAPLLYVFYPFLWVMLVIVSTVAYYVIVLCLLLGELILKIIAALVIWVFTSPRLLVLLFVSAICYLLPLLPARRLTRADLAVLSQRLWGERFSRPRR